MTAVTKQNDAINESIINSVQMVIRAQTSASLFLQRDELIRKAKSELVLFADFKNRDDLQSLILKQIKAMTDTNELSVFKVARNAVSTEIITRSDTDIVRIK